MTIREWRHTLDIQAEHTAMADGNMSAQAGAQAIAGKIQSFVADHPAHRSMTHIVNDLQFVNNLDELDAVMDRLWDYGDYHRIWIKTAL